MFKTRLVLFRITACGALALTAGALIIGFNGLQDHVGRADVGLVMGAYVKADGHPSDRLRARLQKAVELYQKGFFPSIIVSGGAEKEGPSQALVMKAYLVQKGIPGDRIIVDDVGKNTYFTAQNTAAYMHRRSLKNVLIISQFFHIPRTRLALQRFGVRDLTWAHADGFEWTDVYYLGREVIAMSMYAVRSYR